MAARPAVSPALVLLALLLAGCASSNAADAPAPSGSAASVAAPGDQDPDAGSIRGLVTDDSIQPISGAQVALVDSGVTVYTDDEGAFLITNVPPGRHKLGVGALGYEAALRAVDVLPREELAVSFILRPVAIAEPGHHTFPAFAGFFECRLARPDVFLVGVGRTTGACPVVSTANDKSQFKFKMNNHTTAIVGEMYWQQGSYATSQMLRMSFSSEGRPSTHWWCTKTSATPILWKYELDADGNGTCDSQAYCGAGASQGTTGDYNVPKAKHSLIVSTNTPFGCHDASNLRPVELAFQQHFKMVVTIFDVSYPPDAFSAIVE